MHLTNYSINKTSEDYVRPTESDILMSNEGTKRTLSSLYQTLQTKGVDVDKIKESIARTCGQTMQMYGPLIEHQMNCITGHKPVAGTPF